ncbi:MAG: hypothetical protein Fur0037_12760 [Planctomycetota bacterium]
MSRTLIRAGACGLLLGVLPAQEKGERSPPPELRDLRDRIRALELRQAERENLAKPSPAPGGAQNAFNPTITVFGDFMATLSDDGADPSSNRFSLREVEVDLRAPVTSWADGVLIAALDEELEDDGRGGTVRALALDVEEGYLDLFDLPLDTRLQLGKFRSAFGRNNRLHTHDLPQVTRPLAVRSFLGDEGLSTIGVAASWLLPNPWDEYIELRAEAIDSDGGANSPILGGPRADDPAAVGHLAYFTDLADTTSLEIGGSYLFGHAGPRHADEAHVLGTDLTLTWKDPDRPDWRSFVLGGECFWAQNGVVPPASSSFRNHSFGAYAFAQIQAHRDWYLGVRGDYTEYPDDPARGPADEDRGLSAYATWYADEFIRFRVEYQYVDRIASGVSSGENALWFECTYVFGSHPPHPYWVNR